jgi:ribosomal protein S18 acetylase RimI-like enzyme
MAWHIRYAAEEDAEVVHGIVQAAFAEYRGTVPVLPGALRETLEETRRSIAERRTLLIYHLDDSPATVGGSILSFQPPLGTVRYEPKEDHLYVGRLAVLPSWRGRGVGRKLMEYVEGLAPAMGLTRIRLGTRGSMPSNLAFYERLGYIVVERDEQSRAPDVVVWFEKELATPVVQESVRRT